MISALLDLSYANTKGRFDCSTCKASTKKVRRCAEDRLDFTDKDGVQFPIYAQKGGELYGFCPGKATWDGRYMRLFKVMVIAAETGAMMKSGGIEDQPDWFIDLLGWFLPRFDHIKFSTKAQAVLGDKENGGNDRQPTNRSQSRRK